MGEKGKEKDETALTEETKVKDEDLEKALDIAMEDLNKSENSDEEEDDEDEDEEEEVPQPKAKNNKKLKGVKKSRDNDEPDFEALSKSLPERINEDEEAAETMDGTPFLKALVDTLDEQILELTKAVVCLSDELSDMRKDLRKSRNLEVAQAKLVKSTYENIRGMSETTLPRKAAISNLQIIRKSGTGAEGEKTLEMNKSQALDKLTDLCKAGKLDVREVATCESLLNRNKSLPKHIEALVFEQ